MSPTSPAPAHGQRLFQRSPRFIALLALGAAAMVALSFVPAFAAAVPVDPRDMVAVAVAAVGTNLVSAVVFHRVGPAALAYDVAGLVEVLAMNGGILWLVYRSGRGDSLFWFFYLLGGAVTGAMIDKKRALFALHAAPPIVLVGAFLRVGNVVAAALAAVLAIFCAMAFLIRAKGAEELDRVVREREAALAELARERVVQDRARIARDLHDGIGADLASIAWRAGRLAQGGPAAQADLATIGARATRGMDDLRVVVWALRHTDRPWDDVCAFAEARARELLDGRAELRFEHPASGPSLAGEAAMNVVRVVDEAVRNAVTHGGARHVTVRLSPPPALRLEIEDDGAGIGAEPAGDGGLANLGARARALSLALRVERAPAGGARVVLEAPPA